VYEAESEEVSQTAKPTPSFLMEVHAGFFVKSEKGIFLLKEAYRYDVTK